MSTKMIFGVFNAHYVLNMSRVVHCKHFNENDIENKSIIAYYITSAVQLEYKTNKIIFLPLPKHNNA